MKTQNTNDTYVICVNLPGCLPEMDPYAIRGVDSAYACAQHELDEGDSMGYSLAEFRSALQAGGATIYLNSGYVVDITPLDSLGLSPEEEKDMLDEEGTA